MTSSGHDRVDDRLRRTPLYEEHLAAGARMVEFSGWLLPVQYTSILEEHAAVRSAAGLFDVSHMGELEISGPGAHQVCARAFTNDSRSLAVGQAQYSLLVDGDGRILDDVIVYRLEAERYLVCVNAANANSDLARVRDSVGREACVEDTGAATALLALQGPRAAAILHSLGLGTDDLARFGVRRANHEGVDFWIARTGYTGEDGFELFVGCDRAVQLWRAVLQAGAGHGLVTAGLGARDTLRLEAALPLYGHELDESVTPWEARVGWAVKLNRPDMVGYRALLETRARPPRRRLIGLVLEEGIARHGYAVVQGERPVGLVTSGSYSPSLGRAVALALVDSTVIDARLGVRVRAKTCPATVVGLPFYRRTAGSCGRG